MKRNLAIVMLTAVCLCGRSPRADEGVASQEGSFAALQSVFQKSCVKCHGGADAEGDVDLAGVKTLEQLEAQPELIEKLVEVLDSAAMPPEEETPLETPQRERLVKTLREVLHQVSLQQQIPRAPLRRMNRFQYSNAVKDLFRLNVLVFALPERMLREHGGYFKPDSGKMPAKLTAGNRPLGKSQLIEDCLGGVTPFPQDLRAEHGFDNRADHLTVSPLLLESFLRLSRSIVESRDFNEKTCGIWKEFFAPPEQADRAATKEAVQSRLRNFLKRAFRRPVEDELVDRYTQHVLAQLDAGKSFTESMKTAAAAAIASPRFFYLYDQAVQGETEAVDNYNLASRLSFFLWGSIPDQTLLDLADEKKLHKPEVLLSQVDRMLSDRRLKRFCDSFPGQWLQLDRLVSAVPDRQRYPQFYFKKYRASVHMMLEPLLLFETILIENHSILKFIDSDFAYQSNLLQAWYRDGKQGDPGEDAVTVDFERVPITDRRQGGVITSAAVMTMTSGPTQSKPITRGAWLAGVILNDPPEPPPADVPRLAEEESGEKTLTLRERFAQHRQRADCAGCHRSIDPLGFALENYDAAGIWRNAYDDGQAIDSTGTLLGRHKFEGIVEFKDALLAEKDRFTRAFASHLLAFALGREITVADSAALDEIVEATAADGYRFQTLIKEVVLSPSFQR